MSTEATRAVMAQYFATMDDDGDFGRQLHDDVGWTTLPSGDEVRGRAAVTHHIRVLHERMGEIRTRTFAVAEGTALVEGDCQPDRAPAPGGRRASPDPVPFAVVYDVAGGRIAAMRIYLDESRLPEAGPPG
jgi:ketosteroid isomerase-like protein